MCRDNILAWASNFLESLLIAWQPFWTEVITKHGQRAEALQCEVLDWGLGLEGGAEGPPVPQWLFLHGENRLVNQNMKTTTFINLSLILKPGDHNQSQVLEN